MQTRRRKSGEKRLNGESSAISGPSWRRCPRPCDDWPETTERVSETNGSAIRRTPATWRRSVRRETRDGAERLSVAQCGATVTESVRRGMHGHDSRSVRTAIIVRQLVFPPAIPLQDVSIPARSFQFRSNTIRLPTWFQRRWLSGAAFAHISVPAMKPDT